MFQKAKISGFDQFGVVENATILVKTAYLVSFVPFRPGLSRRVSEGALSAAGRWAGTSAGPTEAAGTAVVKLAAGFLAFLEC